MSSNPHLLSRIAIDAGTSHGKPCIKGYQIWVSSILSDLAEGMTVKDIFHQYPELEQEDILACFAYAAEMTQDITEVTGKIKMIQTGMIFDYQSSIQNEE